MEEAQATKKGKRGQNRQWSSKAVTEYMELVKKHYEGLNIVLQEDVGTLDKMPAVLSAKLQKVIDAPPLTTDDRKVSARTGW